MQANLKIFSKYRGFLLALFFIFVYITACVIALPIKESFEYNSDEGLNLIKSLLYLKGYPLYQQIWSDQPPLFTVFLAFWMELFGISIYQARIMVLFFSAILLWGLYYCLKNEWKSSCGLIAALLLLSSTAYLRLSASVMIGLASLALAMLSICFISSYKKSQSKFHLLLSGIFLALSLEIKLITFFLVPVIIGEIVRINSLHLQPPQKTSLRSALLLWLGSLSAVYFSITHLFFHGNYNTLLQQLITPHLQGAAFKAPIQGPFVLLYTLFFKDYDIGLLAIIGIIAAIKQRQSLLPVAWLGLAFILIFKNRPTWFHHYLLISIPLCWLAAIGFCQAFKSGVCGKRFFKKNFLGWAALCLVVLALTRLPGKYARIVESLSCEFITTEERAILALLSKYKKQSRWIFTDRPIFAFYADIPVPPELAMTSDKRLITGNLTPSYLLTMLKKYQPEQLLLTKLSYYSPYNQAVMAYIESFYSNIYQGHLTNRTWMPVFIKWAPKKNNRRGWLDNFPVIQEKQAPVPLNVNFKLYVRKDIIEKPLDNTISIAPK